MEHAERGAAAEIEEARLAPVLRGLSPGAARRPLELGPRVRMLVAVAGSKADS